MPEHQYEVAVTWTGNTGVGTTNARAYSRNHDVAASGLPTIAASSDPAFRGDPTRWNPEQFFVAALSQCHMLWYLNLAASAGVVVTAYEDRPTGVMIEDVGGGGEFQSVTLNPVVTITAESDATLAEALHHRVGELCFIARSVRTPLDYRITIAQED
ncbi:OsmC family protein [Leucobacter sp. M11]|uniref:OsmC family protein n=1 Tax=Leucobacter sp. M11 TaxID=2993565 RepID=UPI002D7F8EC8|nr:OsmC family protein [Leucobacter sp. M11]MEB4614448.1 OsmC family protein [Leucobacter sp. M11]